MKDYTPTNPLQLTRTAKGDLVGPEAARVVVRVGVHHYTVMLVQGYIRWLTDDGSADAVGLTSSETCEIWISDVPSPERRRSVLWHELAHAMIYEAAGSPRLLDHEIAADVLALGMTTISPADLTALESLIVGESVSIEPIDCRSETCGPDHLLTCRINRHLPHLTTEQKLWLDAQLALFVAQQRHTDAPADEVALCLERHAAKSASRRRAGRRVAS